MTLDCAYCQQEVIEHFRETGHTNKKMSNPFRLIPSRSSGGLVLRLSDIDRVEAWLSTCGTSKREIELGILVFDAANSISNSM